MSSSCTKTETPSEARYVKTEKLCIKKPSTSPSDHCPPRRQELKKLCDRLEDLVSPSPVGVGVGVGVGVKQIGPSPEYKVPCDRPKKPIYTPVGVPGGFSLIDDSVFKRVNAVDEDESGDDEETGDVQYVDCDYCKESHPSYWYNCPKEPCTMCFKVGQHNSVNCPYKSHIPKGAVYDRVKYKMICGCGNLFNEDKWVCTFCPGTRPMLVNKFCVICNRKAQHGTHECPKDLVRAAQSKVIRDHLLLVGSKTFPYSSKT